MDEESDLIYLRARYYDPMSSRMLSEDFHWNTDNMIFGDNNDTATPVPNQAAIIQSSNLYVYCTSNPIRYTDRTGEDIYYYVNSQFRSEAWRDKTSLEKEYGEPVHILEVDTKAAFIEEWNLMGSWAGENVNVSLVFINMHGNPNSISPKSDGTNMIYASDLKTKNVGGIVLLNCNTGHFDHRYSSFANKMLVKNNTNFVIASDGTVHGEKKGLINRTMNYVSKGDSTFVSYNWNSPDKGRNYRSNFGFIKYTKNSNGELEWTILGTSLSIRQMR